jgi:hypothetical protein
MKALLLAISVLGCSLAATGQNATYKYHFKGNLNEIYTTGPALTTKCSTGTFVSEALPVGVTKQTYRFEKGCGLTYNDASKNFISAGTYTIELYFKLDTISGYKKLIDFDSLKVDPGLYNLGGKVVLYPSFTSADSFMAAGVYQYIAITRDAASKKMYINANGKSAGTYTDNTDQYKLGADKLLTFFQDDKSTNAEHTKGTVAMIQISNYVIDSNKVKTNYTLLNNTLDVPVMIANAAHIYPNPATYSIYVSVVSNASYSVTDFTGKTVMTGTLRQGDNKISLESLAGGVYLLKTTRGGAGSDQVFRFVKL